jgi:hypothetical protein
MVSDRSFVMMYHLDKDCPILLEYNCGSSIALRWAQRPVAHDNVPCAAVGLLYYGVGVGLEKPASAACETAALRNMEAGSA